MLKSYQIQAKTRIMMCILHFSDLHSGVESHGAADFLV